MSAIGKPILLVMGFIERKKTPMRLKKRIIVKSVTRSGTKRWNSLVPIMSRAMVLRGKL